MSTAVYLRVSSKSQKLDSQRREIERYLSAHEITDARWFIDDGISGATMDRPGLDELKRAIFAGEIRVVVTYAIDRLARNAVEGMNLIADWLGRGVRLIVLTLQVDFSGDVGRMIASLLLHIAEMERNRIRERQASGIAAYKDRLDREGRTHPGGRPKGSFKVDPARASELAAKGLKRTEISRALGVSLPTVRKMLAVGAT